MRRFLAVAAIAASSCATVPAVTPFLSPDGRQAYGILCEDGMSACYTRAREACGGDYEVMRTVDTSVPYTNPATGQLYALADQRLYVTCASPKPPS